MTKILVIFDLILGVICGVRHEYKSRNTDIQQVRETYIVTPNDTLVVDSVYYTPIDSL